MQTITTTYHGPTNYRGSRITARASGAPGSVTIPFDYGSEDSGHAQAAFQLKEKLGWTGEMVGGGTKNGMVWVFTSGPKIPA